MDIMGSFSLMHWIVVLAIVMILFGAGKLPRVDGRSGEGHQGLQGRDARRGRARRDAERAGSPACRGGEHGVAGDSCAPTVRTTTL